MAAYPCHAIIISFSCDSWWSYVSLLTPATISKLTMKTIFFIFASQTIYLTKIPPPSLLMPHPHSPTLFVPFLSHPSGPFLYTIYPPRTPCFHGSSPIVTPSSILSAYNTHASCHHLLPIIPTTFSLSRF